jgi:hypothetical protein
MGVVGLLVTVLLTLPVALSQISLSNRISEVWPNLPTEEIWPGAMISEIWPNLPTYGIWSDSPTDELWPTSA